jgi:hypothetical protein
VSLLLYMILRGGSVAARAKASIHSRGGSLGEGGLSPTAELANAKTMLDEGTIDQVEFTMLKSKILA